MIKYFVVPYVDVTCVLGPSDYDFYVYDDETISSVFNQLKKLGLIMTEICEQTIKNQCYVTVGVYSPSSSYFPVSICGKLPQSSESTYSDHFLRDL